MSIQYNYSVLFTLIYRANVIKILLAITIFLTKLLDFTLCNNLQVERDVFSSIRNKYGGVILYSFSCLKYYNSPGQKIIYDHDNLK